MNKITINGKTFEVEGENVCIKDGQIIVDGKTLDGVDLNAIPSKETRGISSFFRLSGRQEKNRVHIVWEGPVANLSVEGDVECGDINGNVSASRGVVCKDVSGDVIASDGIICGDIGGYADAGDGINCSGNIKGNVDAGDNVNCKDIGGSIDVGGNVTCGNVNGDVKAGQNIHCKTIYGDVECERFVSIK